MAPLGKVPCEKSFEIAWVMPTCFGGFVLLGGSQIFSAIFLRVPPGVLRVTVIGIRLAI